MSILIKGMEMPRDASLWLLIRPDGKVHKLKVGGKYGEPQQGVAVPLPEGHGRLIDADALKHELMVSGIIDYYGTQINLKIDNSPTIVPAEGGEADDSKL